MKNIISICIILVFFSACKKYEDGPSMSLHSKKHRVVGPWFISFASEDGADKTADYQTNFYGYELLTNIDNQYSITYTYGNIFNYAETGTWDFDKTKEHLLLTKNGSSTEKDWTILQLKERALWVRYTDNATNPAKTVEIHFVP